MSKIIVRSCVLFIAFWAGQAFGEQWENIGHIYAQNDVDWFGDADTLALVNRRLGLFSIRLKSSLKYSPSYRTNFFSVDDYIFSCNELKIVRYLHENFDLNGIKIDRQNEFASIEEAISTTEKIDSGGDSILIAICKKFANLTSKIATSESKLPTKDLALSAKGRMDSKSSTFRIPLRKRGGVYEVKATLNSEITTYFIVDSGASDVTISSSLAELLVHNNSISTKDVIGEKVYSVANGMTSRGVEINIKSIEIGGHVISNVTASVIQGRNVPLLLGQSALQRLGKWNIDAQSRELIFAP